MLKGKKLTNIRTTSKDEAVRLTPPIRMTLEKALAYIEDDELVEVTPKSIRLRKKLLDENDRKKEERKKEAETVVTCGRPLPRCRRIRPGRITSNQPPRPSRLTGEPRARVANRHANRVRRATFRQPARQSFCASSLLRQFLQHADQ